MTVAHTRGTKAAGRIADAVLRLSRVTLADTMLLNSRAAQGAHRLECLVPIDRIVDRLDRSCERRRRTETT